MQTLQPSMRNLETQPKKRSDVEEVETITAAYLKGEIDLATYDQKISEVNKPLDLRRLASKLGFRKRKLSR
jgi:hypothetical protein